jgi:serine protease AprX
MQLSGTSMAAAVVSGAVALLFDHRPGMKVFAVKGTFQVTSSAVGSEGLIGVGAGSLNALAAISFTSERNGNSSVPVTLIGGQSVTPRGVLIVPMTDPDVRAQTIIWGQTIVWGQTIIWGQTVARGETIIWEQSTRDTIVWGQSAGDTIIWGQDAGDTIIWGQNAGDTIIWGQSDGDTIIWGTNVATTDTIIWGNVSL